MKVEDHKLNAEDSPGRWPPDTPYIRKVRDADVPHLARALACAFHDDPLIGRWVFREEASRMRRLASGFELYIRRIWLRHDECYTTDRNPGAAMWLPPGKWQATLRQQVLLVPPLAAALGRDLPRLLRLMSSIEARHPDEQHYYLPAIGVAPHWQGRGLGSALLCPVLERCDRERQPAYLEASSPRNRALYERHGFEVVEEMTVNDSPAFWRMWRDPGDV